MKTGNKRLIAFVAILAALFLAGSAFAFAAAGPLLFQGAANVDAALSVEIVHAEIAAINPHPNFGFGNSAEVTVSPDGRTAYFNIAFTQVMQSADFRVRIENTGTMPAEMHDVLALIENSIPGLDILLTASVLTGIVPPQGPAIIGMPIANFQGHVLQPGEHALVMVLTTLNFDPSFTGSYINNYAAFRLELNYGLAR